MPCGAHLFCFICCRNTDTAPHFKYSPVCKAFIHSCNTPCEGVGFCQSAIRCSSKALYIELLHGKGVACMHQAGEKMSTPASSRKGCRALASTMRHSQADKKMLCPQKSASKVCGRNVILRDLPSHFIEFAFSFCNSQLASGMVQQQPVPFAWNLTCRLVSLNIESCCAATSHENYAANLMTKYVVSFADAWEAILSGIGPEPLYVPQDALSHTELPPCPESTRLHIGMNN